MPTKLPQYVLPLYPARAFLAGGALAHGFWLRLTGCLRWAANVVSVLREAVTITLAAALVVLPNWLGSGTSFSAIIASAALLVLAPSLLINRRRPFLAACLVGALAAVFVLPWPASSCPGSIRCG